MTKEQKTSSEVTIPLTPSEIKFCESYVETRSISRTIASVPQLNLTPVKAREFVKDPRVVDYIDKLIQGYNMTTIAKPEEVLEFLSNVMRSDKVSYKYRVDCAELLGKSYGLFTEKVDISSSSKLVIVDDLDRLDNSNIIEVEYNE